MSKHRKNSRRKKYINRTLIKFAKVLFLLFEIIGFPKYFSKFSNKIFNNWQLFALLIIRAKTKQSPEDLVEQFLPGNEGLLNALALAKIPTASALRKFARGLKARWGHTALAGCAALAGLNDVCSGIDGTGHSKLKGSKHYYRRSKKETVWSVVKQKMGDAVTSLKFHMQKIELLCRYLAYNIDRILTLQKKSKIMQLFSDELKIILMEDLK